MKDNFLQYFTIHKILLLLFVMLSIMLVSNYTLEQVKLRKTRSAINYLTTKSRSRQSHLFKIRKDIDSVHVNLLLILFNTVEFGSKSIIAEMEQEIIDAENNIREYKKLTTDATEQRLLKRLIKNREKNNADRNAVINLILDNKRNEAIALESKSLFSSYEEYQQAVSELSEYTNARDKKQVDIVGKSFFHYEKINSIFNLSIFILMTILGLIIFRVMRILKKANASLAESERKYRSLIELTTEIIETADDRGKYVSVNNAFKKKLGYDDDEISNLTIMDVLAPESKQPYRLNPSKEEFGDIITGIKTTLLSKNGENVFVEGNIILNYNDETFESSTAFFNDITEKVMAEKALIASEKRYHQLFDLSPLPIWVINPNNLRIEQVNNTAISLYGYTREEFLSLTINDLEVNDNTFLEKVLSSSTRDDSFYGEGRHRKKNNEIMDVILHAKVFEQSNKKHVIVIGDDVTERNHNQWHLEKQNKKLKSIAWTQSHIVRAPLSTMMGLISLIGDESTTMKEKEELLNHVLDAANELDKILKDIVDKSWK